MKEDAKKPIQSKSLYATIAAVAIVVFQYVAPQFDITPLPDDVVEVLLVALVGSATYARLFGKPAQGQLKNPPSATTDKGQAEAESDKTGS